MVLIENLYFVWCLSDESKITLFFKKNQEKRVLTSQMLTNISTKLKNLKELNLSKCNITLDKEIFQELCWNFAQWQQLRTLSLSNNHIVQIPTELGLLQSLEQLGL
jgi:Leucine-rich repeat (LRR) protein